MKKLFVLFLTLLLCMVLTACGSDGSAKKQNAETMASDIIVHVEINPSFDIYVDNCGIIDFILCLNEDAKTVYAEMDLSETYYDDGLTQLLTAVYDAGFLSEDAKINVEIQQKSTVDYEVSEITNEVLADFHANVAAAESEVKKEVVEVVPPKADVITEPDLTKAMGLAEENCLYMIFIDLDYGTPAVQFYVDENDVIIWTYYYEHVAEEFQNVGINGKYAKDGILAILNRGYELGFSSENISCNASISNNHDGDKTYIARMTHFQKKLAESFWRSQIYVSFNMGLCSEDHDLFSGEYINIQTDSDGVWWKIINRYENGSPRQQERISQYGDIEKYEYSEEGAGIIYKYFEGIDGRIGEVKYNDQGVAIYCYDKWSDGTIGECEYNDQGIVIYSYYKYPDGTTHTQWFDDNGNLIKEE